MIICGLTQMALMLVKCGRTWPTRGGIAGATVEPKPGGPARHDEPPLPNGVYGAQTRAGCGAPRQFGISVTVHDGQIKWQHDAPLVANGPPVTMLWEGSIDRDGNIKASVAEFARFRRKGTLFRSRARSGDALSQMHRAGNFDHFRKAHEMTTTPRCTCVI